jgi:hypothetical protein
MLAFPNTMDRLSLTWLQEGSVLRSATSSDFFHEIEGHSKLDAAPRHWLVDPFRSISLEQLNAKAAMLERLDNKYVVREGVLRQAITELAKHFDILENEGKRDFTYETCYFDDVDHRSYFDHHQGRRKRCKVRVRKYTDAQLCFVEVKLKDKRGVTVKKRLKYPLDKYGMLDANAWAHIRSAYSEVYGTEFDRDLKPTVEMRYQRITLVAKQGGERMTIDRNLMFSAGSRRCFIDESTFVVETKSANANGIADKILRRLHQHPTKRCSKYCIAMATLEKVKRHNKFLPALRKLSAIPGSRQLDEMLTEHSAIAQHGFGHASLVAT